MSRWELSRRRTRAIRPSHRDEAVQHVLVVAAQRHFVQFVDFAFELLGGGVERVEVPVEHGHQQQHRGQATDLALILDALMVLIEERDRIGMPRDGPSLADQDVQHDR